MCALHRGCVRAVCAALTKLYDFLMTFGWHSHCQPVCLRDVLTSSWGNVMHSAYPAFPSSPCECSAKVQLIQSLVDDSRHSVPFCTDAQTHTHKHGSTHTHTPQHMHHGAWLDEDCEVSAASASQHTCEMISCSPTSLPTQTLLVSVFYLLMHRHALSFTIFLSAFLISWCLSLTPTQTFPLSWMYSRET